MTLPLSPPAKFRKLRFLMIANNSGCTSRRSMARFKLPCAIPEIGSLHQQKLPGAIGDINQERLVGGSGLDTLLHHLKFNINDPAQFLVAQRFEYYDLVQTVDELR